MIFPEPLSIYSWSEQGKQAKWPYATTEKAKTFLNRRFLFLSTSRTKRAVSIPEATSFPSRLNHSYLHFAVYSIRLNHSSSFGFQISMCENISQYFFSFFVEKEANGADVNTTCVATSIHSTHIKHSPFYPPVENSFTSGGEPPLVSVPHPGASIRD